MSSGRSVSSTSASGERAAQAPRRHASDSGYSDQSSSRSHPRERTKPNVNSRFDRMSSSMAATATHRNAGVGTITILPRGARVASSEPKRKRRRVGKDADGDGDSEDPDPRAQRRRQARSGPGGDLATIGEQLRMLSAGYGPRTASQGTTDDFLADEDTDDEQRPASYLDIMRCESTSGSGRARTIVHDRRVPVAPPPRRNSRPPCPRRSSSEVLPPFVPTPPWLNHHLALPPPRSPPPKRRASYDRPIAAYELPPINPPYARPSNFPRPSQFSSHSPLAPSYAPPPFSTNGRVSPALSTQSAPSAPLYESQMVRLPHASTLLKPFPPFSHAEALEDMAAEQGYIPEDASSSSQAVRYYSPRPPPQFHHQRQSALHRLPEIPKHLPATPSFAAFQSTSSFLAKAGWRSPQRTQESFVEFDFTTRDPYVYPNDSPPPDAYKSQLPTRQTRSDEVHEGERDEMAMFWRGGSQPPPPRPDPPRDRYSTRLLESASAPALHRTAEPSFRTFPQTFPGPPRQPDFQFRPHHVSARQPTAPAPHRLSTPSPIIPRTYPQPPLPPPIPSRPSTPHFNSQPPPSRLPPQQPPHGATIYDDPSESSSPAATPALPTFDLRPSLGLSRHPFFSAPLPSNRIQPPPYRPLTSPSPAPAPLPAVASNPPPPALPTLFEDESSPTPSPERLLSLSQPLRVVEEEMERGREVMEVTARELGSELEREWESALTLQLTAEEEVREAEESAGDSIFPVGQSGAWEGDEGVGGTEERVGAEERGPERGPVGQYDWERQEGQGGEWEEEEQILEGGGFGMVVEEEDQRTPFEIWEEPMEDP